MLKTLSIVNFAIIDQLNLQFKSGLTTITGETGAGKSILLGALKLVLGERADLKSLKDDSKKCIVEATFNVEKLHLKNFFQKNELDYEAESILRRELLPSGKSRAFINDTPVNLTTLQTLSKQLIDIHSQFNTKQLLEDSFQFKLLDSVANQLDLVKEFKKNYKAYNQLNKNLQEAQNKLTEQQKNKEYNLFLLEELNEAKLQVNEIEELDSELKALNNIDEIMLLVNEFIQRADDSEVGVSTQFQSMLSLINKSVSLNSELSELSERFNAVKIEFDDLLNDLQQKALQLEANPERLAILSERMNTLQRLLNKHQVLTIDDLISIKNDLEQENNANNNLIKHIEDLNIKVSESIALLNKLANKITKGRENAIPTIHNSILSTLKQLGMENANLNIELTKLNTLNEFGENGVSFLFSANNGMPLKSIEKAISGGELSRLMLAIKKIMATNLNLPTLILDEIDTGVSGKIANEMGKVMLETSQHLQVISITHLPQVAAKGKEQFKVFKSNKNNIVTTEVKLLNNEERIQEIAELISGDSISESAINQAKEILAN